MNYETIMTIVPAVAGITCFLCLIAILAYDVKAKRDVKLYDKSGRDWLFSDFDEALFDVMYKKPAKSYCGINVDDYERYCTVLHMKPDLKGMVATRLKGALIGGAFVFAALMVMKNTTAALAMLSFAGIVFYFLWVKPYATLKSRGEEQIFRIHNDLPRFLALLDKAIDLPIDQAMRLTAEKFESPLSSDIIESLNQVSLGADGWQSTLFRLAKSYQIEDFSDLVLEIINSYTQGIQIGPLINRKAYEVEQNRMFAVEEHDSKIKTLIYVPIIFLKVVPIMVMICLPMASNFG